VGERLSAASSSATSSAAIIARLGGAHLVPSRVQDAAERAVAAGLQRLNRPGLEAALVASIPARRSARDGRWRRLRRSTFNRATRSKRQPGSAFKAARLHGGTRHGYSPRVHAVGSAKRLGAAKTPNGARGTLTARAEQMTLRAALLESNNAAAANLQQRVGARTVLRGRGRRRTRRPARRAVARAGQRPGVADRSDCRLHDVPGRGSGGASPKASSASSTGPARRCSTGRVARPHVDSEAVAFRWSACSRRSRRGTAPRDESRDVRGPGTCRSESVEHLRAGRVEDADDASGTHHLTRARNIV